MKTTTAIRIGALATVLLLLATIAFYLVLRPTAACGCGPDPTRAQERIDARAYYDDFEDSDRERGGFWGGLGGRRTVSEQHATSDGSSAAATPDPGGERVPPARDLPPRPWPGPGDGNVYVDAGTRGFVSPAVRPTSTFGLDVDTGSFSIARTSLQTGSLPDPASIRPEEWVNALSYDDPAPQDTDLGLTTESTNLTGSAETSLVRVGVTAREVAASERPPAAVTFLVDTSGSMNIRERLGLAKSSLALLAKNLRPTDTISIVTYSDTARAVLPPTHVRRTSTILDAIDDLESTGSTNLEGGLDLAYAQARKSFRTGGINTVVLASDGVANVGATNPDALARKIRAAAADDDINLVSVGFGMGSYNDDLMEQLADQGQGFYGYVDTFAEAERLFVRQLTSTLTVVASDAKAQATFDPDKVESYRLVGYENRALADEDFDDASVDAGEIGSGHQASALYEVRLADGVEGGTVIGRMSARWRAGAYGAGEAGRSVDAAVDLEAPTAGTRPSYDLRLASLTARFALALKSAGTGERPSLADLQTEADQLARGGADRAEELATMIERARTARVVGGEPPRRIP